MSHVTFLTTVFLLFFTSDKFLEFLLFTPFFWTYNVVHSVDTSPCDCRVVKICWICVVLSRFLIIFIPALPYLGFVWHQLIRYHSCIRSRNGKKAVRWVWRRHQRPWTGVLRVLLIVLPHWPELLWFKITALEGSFRRGTSNVHLSSL